MSHKNKHHSNLKTDPSTPQSVPVLHKSEKAPEARMETAQRAATDTAGLTWQPLFVLAIIVLGVLVLLVKSLGLF